MCADSNKRRACTDKAALPPGSASGPARWRSLWVPSPPLEWCSDLHSPPPAEPETVQKGTYTNREDRRARTQTDKPIKHRARVTITQRHEQEAVQEFSKENSSAETDKQRQMDIPSQGTQGWKRRMYVHEWTVWKGGETEKQSDKNTLSGSKDTTWFNLLQREVSNLIFHFWDELTSKSCESGWYYR